MINNTEIVCMNCENVPCGEIKTLLDYEIVVKNFERLIEMGEFELVYQTCPLDKIVADGKFYDEKMFHQFRCTTCGKIFGLFVNANVGGQLSVNQKVFNPDDYPDKEG